MTRVHPQFLMNGMKKAMETQDFDEFNKCTCAKGGLNNGKSKEH